MKHNQTVSEHVRPMLAAMAKSIDAARARRTASSISTTAGSSEGMTFSSEQLRVGNPTADNGKAKACPKLPASTFFREREKYRKTG